MGGQTALYLGSLGGIALIFPAVAIALGSWTAVFLGYLGGLALIPFVVLLLWLKFTVPDPPAPVFKGHEALTRNGDGYVASGFFALSREFGPMDLSGEPVERATALGSTIAVPSPSVYQTMYRNIFDRKLAPNPLDYKGRASQRPRKAGQWYFAVIRHGHVMFYDDDQQLDPRHHLSLALYDVSIFSGEDEPTPEGELFIKKNAISLTLKDTAVESMPDTQHALKHLYLFSKNCSAKEDFYFSLLREQAQSSAGDEAGPGVAVPQQFDVRHILGLLERVHSSEDHVPTRWLNTLIGRIFLGLYRTKDTEQLIMDKLNKKLARAEKPSLLSAATLSIKRIETGDAAPYFTNINSKNLSVDGTCELEADVKYTGNFSMEVAASFPFSVPGLMKTRRLPFFLSVVIRKIEGHALLKIKAPPSNRVWVAFKSLPKIEWDITPNVYTQQVNMAWLRRQIGDKLKDVLAETMVLPFWDDTPFSATEHKKWRGGIFEGDDAVIRNPDIEQLTAETEMGFTIEEADALEQASTMAAGPSSQPAPAPDLLSLEQSRTLPTMEKTHTSFFGRRLNGKSTASSINHNMPFSSSSTSIESSVTTQSAPVSRPARSGSIASPSEPVVGTDPTNADVFRPSSPPTSCSPAVQAMTHLSVMAQSPRQATPTAGSAVAGPSNSGETTPSRRSREPSMLSTEQASSRPSSRASSVDSERGYNSAEETLPDPVVPRRSNTMSTVTDAANNGRRWVMNALQRRADVGVDLSKPIDLSKPMGGGQPLPPPGTPLPMPAKRNKVPIIPVMPKRRPVATAATPTSLASSSAGAQDTPAPPLPPRPTDSAGQSDQSSRDSVVGGFRVGESSGSSVTNDNRSRRRKRHNGLGGGDGSDDAAMLLVVEAPAEPAESPRASEGEDERNNDL